MYYLTLRENIPSNATIFFRLTAPTYEHISCTKVIIH